MRSVFVILSALCLSLASLHGIEKHDKFVVVTPPKAGTHLLTKALEQLTDRKCLNIFSTYTLSHEEWKTRLQEAEEAQAFLQIHAHPNPEQIKSVKSLGYKVVFLIRDPRDQAISLLFFIEQKHWSLGPLNLDREPYKSLSFNDKLDEIITGSRTGCSGVEKIFARYAPWAWQGPGLVLTIRFEDLVGDEGGGSREQQVKAVTRMAKFLRLQLTPQQIAERSQGLFGKRGEKTFRKGQIGEWVKYFKYNHSYEMIQRYGDLMKEFGYT